MYYYKLQNKLGFQQQQQQKTWSSYLHELESDIRVRVMLPVMSILSLQLARGQPGSGTGRKTSRRQADTERDRKAEGRETDGRTSGYTDRDI
jgi:hypothetical protein